MGTEILDHLCYTRNVVIGRTYKPVKSRVKEQYIRLQEIKRTRRDFPKGPGARFEYPQIFLEYLQRLCLLRPIPDKA